MPKLAYNPQQFNCLNILCVLGLLLISPITQAHDGNSHATDDYELAELARQRDLQRDNEPVISSQRLAIQEASNIAGEWGPVVQWSFAFASAASLPDGRIIAWGANNTNSFNGGNFTNSAVWDPDTSQFLSTPNANHSMFCGIPTTLEDGRVIVNGGDLGNQATMFHTSIFDYRTNQWLRVDEMNNPRWYAGSVALPNGRVFTAIGERGTQYPELWTPGQGWSILSGSNLQSPILDFTAYQNNWLPYLHLAPNGLIFHSGPTQQMNWLDTSGNGSVSDATLRNTWYPKYSVGVMYDEGKILVAGGGVDGVGQAASTNLAKIIDLNGPAPQQTQQSSMNHARKFANGVVLPTGEVMVIGGNTSGIEFSDSGSVLTPEIWNPIDGTWREVADLAVPRNYHSVALLMADGRVWSGGGGLCACSADHPDSQVYSPGYLFNSDGSLAQRPQITAAPVEAYYGESIQVTATASLARFTMVKMSATTHNLNSDMRFLNVPFNSVGNGIYNLDLHNNPDVLTPGHWMLFAINQQGVPSVAKILRVSSLPAGSGTGEILREWWTNINGVDLASLESHPNFPDNPSGSDTKVRFEAPSNWADNYGTRMRGYIHPPLSGQYRFWIASDDNGQLRLSDSADPDGAIPIANVFSWTQAREWDKLPEQSSALITLQAGQKYYIEAVQNEGTGGDNLAVAWQFQDGFRSVIDGQYLSPFTTNESPVINRPDSQTNEEGDTISLAISATDPEGDNLEFNASGLPNGLTINSNSGLITGTIASNAAGNYNVTISVSDGTTSSTTTFTWSVLADGALVIRYDFEDEQGWIPDPNGSDTATAGQWERANPENTSSNGTTFQLGNTVSGQRALVTGALAGASAGTHDVDNGKTSIQSPEIVIPSDSQATITFSYYLAHLDNASSSDYLRVRAIGNNTVVLLEELGANNIDAADWIVFSGSLSNFAGQTIHLEFEAADHDTGSLLEAAIDDVVISITGNNQPPALTHPGNQVNTQGENISLQIIASDPDGDSLNFSAANLPPGTSINSTTGLISGILTTTGTYSVDLTVSDGRGGNDTVNFNWLVNDAPELVLSPINTSPRPMATSISYTAIASGGLNPRFKWNFGDNSAETSFSSSPAITHTFTNPGRYIITLIATDDTGANQQLQFLQLVHAPLTNNRPVQSMSIVYNERIGNDRIWNVNPDNNTVSVFDTVTTNQLAEINVGISPRSLSVVNDDNIWVTNSQDASISIIDASTFTVMQTIALPRGSRPYGIAADPDGNNIYIALESSGRLLRFDPSTLTQTASIDVGANPRHLSINSDGSKIYVSRFITPPVPGEETASPQVNQGGGELVVISANTMSISTTIKLLHSNRNDTENSGRGIPNYLGPMVISPDGLSAWTPSKQDNIQRGGLRDGQNLTFETSVRSISSRVDLINETEDHLSRIDHNNGGIAVTGSFDLSGNHFFAALEGSREIAVLDNYARSELLRFDAGRAPQGLALSSDGLTLYVHNFMDRSITVHDLSNLFAEVSLNAQNIITQDTLDTTSNELLPDSVLLGKQLFYDARDTRLARDAYMSCAACHNDGGHDGRVWDFTQFGEGLRNTIDLNGHGGIEHGLLHWTANFDELQDFEGQIRNFAGGSGLMTNTDFSTTSDPLGLPKAGLSSDLDALAAYMTSLTTFGNSPFRNADGTLTPEAATGKVVFERESCASCHLGQGFTDSALNLLHDIGTIKTTSGNRIGGLLTGLDTPTLRGLWATAPYLHDGSAATVEDAVVNHSGVSLSTSELNELVTYLLQIDQQEPAPDSPTLNNPPAILDVSNQSSVIGDTINLVMSASDPDGDVLTFSANGLPSGLAIDSNSGVINGSVNSSGNSNVVVSVQDGNGGSDSTSFVWSVTDLNSEIVAHYQGDYQTGSALSNWEYLWNNQGPIGQAVHYTSMLWNGSYYDSDGVPGVPDTTDLSYGSLKAGGGHPGRGVSQGQSDDRYVIAAFTVNRSGHYQIVQSQITDNGCTRNGGHVAIYVNDTLIHEQTYGPVTDDFDTIIDDLIVGDTIYVAVGPNGSDGCDGFAWDYMLEVSGSGSSGNLGPNIINPGNQISTVDSAVSLAISASDPDGDSLSYSASGLPSGLSINSATGLIGGVPVITGNSNVVVTVQDGNGGVNSTNFNWTINSVSSEIIAHFQSDYQANSPAPGWQYLWNELGPVGQSSNYSSLQWNGSFFDSDGAAGVPDATDLSYGSIKPDGGHPGRGVSQGQSDDRYVIAAYTVSRPGDYWIVQSQITDTGCTRNGGLVEIYANDVFINQQTFGPVTASFDNYIGDLNNEDTIYIAVGPDGSDGCDGFSWDFMLEVTDTSSNSSPILVNPGDQSSTVGDNANVSISASDSDGDSLQFSAINLPTGLSIDSLTGLISGIFSVPGTFNSSINVNDGQGGNDAVNFLWNVSSLTGGQNIASYQSDFTDITPAPGWSYLWNAGSSIGQSSHYIPLQWNGSYYDSDGAPGLPDTSGLGYGSLRPTRGHAGRGTSQGESDDRFVIAAYQVDQAGNYQITQSLVTHTGCPHGNGSEVRIYINDNFVLSQTYDQGDQTTFDVALGLLTENDVIYVALGPNGSDGCDSFTWDYTISIIN